MTVAGNWKMNKTPAESKFFAGELADEISHELLSQVNVVVCPSASCIDAVTEVLRGTGICTGAQNVFYEDFGAYTGETSGLMIKELGCSHAIIGHSERRQVFGETDEEVNKKLHYVLGIDLVPIVCVGETLEERESGKMEAVLEGQIREGLRGISREQLNRIIIAYEPIWAIGTGVVATPEQADEAMGFIRGLISELFGKGVAQECRILYGGSIKPGNFDELVSLENIDGGLVGGASLDKGFIELVKIAAKHSR